MNETTKKGENTLYRTYNYIIEYMSTNGYAPSIRDIANGVGLSSTSSVHYQLTMLRDMGKIAMKKKASRAIKVIGYHFEKDKE